MDHGGPLLAECANCASFREGACARGLAPPPGEARCDRYQIGGDFAKLIADRFLQANPFAAPIPTRPLSNSERRRMRNRPPPRPRRGFRS